MTSSKLRITVGASILIFLIVVGNIMLFGLLQNPVQDKHANNTLFFISYFIFSLIAFGLLVYALKDSFEKRSDVILLAILGVFICLALSVTASSFKAYNENRVALNQMQPVYEAEISGIAQSNEYYDDYIGYLQTSIITLKSDSQRLQEEIDVKSVLLQEQAIPEPEIQTYVYNYRVYEKEEDEWWDDD